MRKSFTNQLEEGLYDQCADPSAVEWLLEKPSIQAMCNALLKGDDVRWNKVQTRYTNYEKRIFISSIESTYRVKGKISPLQLKWLKRYYKKCVVKPHNNLDLLVQKWKL